MQNGYGSSLLFNKETFDSMYAYNNSTTLSSFNHSNQNNANMLQNIGALYQVKVGLENCGTMEIGDLNTAVMYVKGDNPEIYISRHNGSGISDHLDDFNNFMNIIVHEDGHRRDGNVTNFGHTNNYLTQSKHDTWFFTTATYKNLASTNAANYLNDAMRLNGVSPEAIIKRVNDFNAVPFGIRLNYNDKTRLVTPVKVSQLETITIEK